MKAWQNMSTDELFDIQTIPGPLPDGYDPEEWELVEIPDAELDTYLKPLRYRHTERGLQGLFDTNFITTIIYTLGELL